MRPFEERIHIGYVNVDVVSEYYGVSKNTVIGWIKQGKISGIQSTTNPDHYLIPKDEFEYLKRKREQDNTEDVIKDLLGGYYSEDWEVELEE
ncbi:helix-turn-helix domain-containing protein [Heyndrickxia faecalis]|uniref:helix-turn-helix domain-containing protein n=1 Tax=Heyndrickxia faecalis TaxID=2824910 RepID=UPI003D1BFC3D